MRTADRRQGESESVATQSMGDFLAIVQCAGVEPSVVFSFVSCQQVIINHGRRRKGIC